MEIKDYKAPQTKVIDMNVLGILCLSNGNESMPEVDYGDAGFSEE